MIKTVLFDMGGVVFVQVTAEAFRRFSAIGIDAGEYLGVYGQKGIFLDLESGRIDTETFRRELSSLCGRELTQEEVQRCWLGFIDCIPSSRLDNLRLVRERYRVCLASNTNPYSMAYMRSGAFSGDGRGIGHWFDGQYCSYEMGVCKPRREFFERIISSEGVDPSELLFIDDSRKNIEAAEALGIRGLWIEQNSDWMPELSEYLATQQP